MKCPMKNKKTKKDKTHTKNQSKNTNLTLE